jgi:hypothetical protein
MPRRFTVLLLATALLVLLASYVLRYSLMEGDQWVALCGDEPTRFACQVRSFLGTLIHFRVIGSSALALAVLSTLLPGVWGRRLAVPGMLLGLPALVLYGASVAAFAVVLALLRLVRAAA